MRRASVAALALALLAGGASAAGDQPTTGARAWAVRVLLPNGNAVGTPVLTQARAATQVQASFAYPASGAIVRTGRASAAVARGDTSASSSTVVGRVSIFRGEVTVRTVGAGVRGGATFADFHGTTVVGLRVHGKPVSKRRVALGRWGTLVVRRSAEIPGNAGFHSFVTAVDIHLSVAHGGLPAGSEVQIGHADLTLPSPPAPPLPAGPLPGDRPQLLPHVIGPFVGVPQLVTPPLGAGPYVFPVYGPVSYSDGYGGVDFDTVGYHHGDDLFGEVGQPLLAAASGTVFRVGWARGSGNRLWLRDHEGNLFYYAHLAAFSTNARNGSRVNAGEVIGFMGNTGNAEGATTHLHFEVHPVSLIYLGADGAVDPTSYLASWRRLRNLPFPVPTGWAPSPSGGLKLPEPGALLIGATDIATGGLGASKP